MWSELTKGASEVCICNHEFTSVDSISLVMRMRGIPQTNQEKWMIVKTVWLDLIKEDPKTQCSDCFVSHKVYSFCFISFTFDY